MTSDRWRLRARRAALGVSRMSRARRSSRARAPGWQRAWVMAARWTAALSCRLPPRFRRQVSLLPLEAGTGAVPLCRA